MSAMTIYPLFQPHLIRGWSSFCSSVSLLDLCVLVESWSNFLMNIYPSSIVQHSRHQMSTIDSPLISLVSFIAIHIMQIQAAKHILYYCYFYSVGTYLACRYMIDFEVAYDADPLALDSTIRVAPKWTRFQLHLPSELTSAGLNEDRSSWNIASAMVDGQQVLGYSSNGGDLSYCSHEGVRSRAGAHVILNNVNEYDWVGVTVKTLQTFARKQGVKLAICSYCSRKRYACRIKFYGWRNNLGLDKSSFAKKPSKHMLTEGPENELRFALPGHFREGSHTPVFSYKGKRTWVPDEDQIVELLCYKKVSLPYW